MNGFATSMYTSLVAALVVFCPACASERGGSAEPTDQPRPAATEHSTMNDVDQIHNRDLRWDGNYVGLTPTIANPETAALVAAGPAIDPALVEALGDRERFAIAHVLLTLRSKQPFEVSADAWNDLHVTLEPSGEVRYAERDRLALREKWAGGR